MKKELVTKRNCALLLIEVLHANPNGDPDWEGRPRVLPDQRGMISPVSFKRRFRDILQDHTTPVFGDLMTLAKLPTDQHDSFHVYESHMRGFSDVSDMEARNMAFDLLSKNPAGALARYVDLRWFGATILETNPEKEAAKQIAKQNRGKKKKGEEVAEPEAEEPAAEEEKKASVRFKKTGPITISQGISIAPVMLQEGAITKTAAIRDGLVGHSGDMAPGAIKAVMHGLYAMRISVNPNLSRAVRRSKDGVPDANIELTQTDLNLFKKMIQFVYSATEAGARPANSIRLRRCWWAEHANSLGSFNETKFFDHLMPVKNSDPDQPSQSISDYTFPEPPPEWSSSGLAVIDILK